MPKPDTASGDIAGRAAFFAAIERHGVPEGLQNIYLPEALTLAPYHPYITADSIPFMGTSSTVN